MWIFPLALFPFLPLVSRNFQFCLPIRNHHRHRKRWIWESFFLSNKRWKNMNGRLSELFIFIFSSRKSYWFNNVMWFTLLSQNATHSLFFFSFDLHLCFFLSSTPSLMTSKRLVPSSKRQIVGTIFCYFFLCEFILASTLLQLFLLLLSLSLNILYVFPFLGISPTISMLNFMDSLIHVGCVIRTSFNCWRHMRIKQKFIWLWSCK